MYVIVRTTNGKYLTPQDARRTWAVSLRDARLFATREEAERELCNEWERVEAVAAGCREDSHIRA